MILIYTLNLQTSLPVTTFHAATSEVLCRDMDVHGTIWVDTVTIGHSFNCTKSLFERKHSVKTSSYLVKGSFLCYFIIPTFSELPIFFVWKHHCDTSANKQSQLHFKTIVRHLSLSLWGSKYFLHILKMFLMKHFQPDCQCTHSRAWFPSHRNLKMCFLVK